MSDNWGEDDRLDARGHHAVDHYDPAGDEEWYEVTRRYRRGLGGWWWLALLAIPLLLALLGSLLGGDDEDSSSDDTSSTSQESQSPVSSESGAAVEAGTFEYSGDQDTARLTATVPSEADRDALVKAVEDANEGRTVDAQVSVDDKAPLLEGKKLTALTAALTAGGTDLAISGDASDLTLTGEVADDAAKKKVAQQLAVAFPEATIANQLTVAKAAGTPSAPASSEAPATSEAPASSEAPATSEAPASSEAPSSQAPEPSQAETSSAAPTESAEPSAPATSQAPATTEAPSSEPTPSTTKSAEPAIKAVNRIEDLTCENAKVSMNGITSAYPIRFGSSSDALYGDSAINAGRIGAALAGCDFDVVVTGHTDNVGGQVNEKLSAYRAEKVAQALVVAGVDFDRIEKVNAAAKQPVASNDDEDGRAKNRRVTIQVK